MAALYDANDVSSPLAYPASQTALVLLDFHRFTIRMCGEAAAVKAALMRRWALSEGILVIHSLIDIKSTPVPTSKSTRRIQGLLSMLANDPDAVDESPELAFEDTKRERLVWKRPGTIDGLKSQAAQELLAERGIKSLIICGLSTSNAVLRTAVPATDAQLVVSIIADACADPDPQLHDVLIKTVLPGQAHVADSSEFIEEWKKAGE